MGQEAPRTVLVVDDDADIRDALEAVLAPHGWQVTTVSDGLGASRMLVGGLRPTVIVLDLMMPRVNGVWFREMQLRDPELAAIPVVVITAFSDAAEKAEQASALFEGVPFIRKPFDAQALVAALDAACVRARTSRARA